MRSALIVLSRSRPPCDGKARTTGQGRLKLSGGRGAHFGVAAVVVVVLSIVARPAAADNALTLSGTWSASGLSEQWSTTEWGDACGPKPSPEGAPGGTVTVAEQGGELSMSGAGRSFNTAQCWEQMPGLTRSSHSAGKRGWSTRCTSAAGDPRHATVVTNVSATDDTIVISEQGTYEFFIEGSSCRASVSRSRSMKLVQRAGDAPAASASAAPVPPPRPSATEPTACGTPGPAVRFSVRPSRKLLRPGDTFSFRASAVDEKGCPTPGRATFRVDDHAGTKLTVDDQGAVTVASDAPEGSATLLVELGGNTVKVSVEVAGKDRYDALLKERGLDAQGEDATAASVEISAGVGGRETKADDVAKKRKQIFVAIVAGLALLLALAGFILVRRGKRPPPPRAAEDEEPGEPPTVAVFERAPNQPMRCPKCDEVFRPDVAFCPNDGAALAPASGVAPISEPVPSAPRVKKSLNMICPTCGDRFETGAQFCGKDGTSLVPIN